MEEPAGGKKEVDGMKAKEATDVDANARDKGEKNNPNKLDFGMVRRNELGQLVTNLI